MALVARCPPAQTPRRAALSSGIERFTPTSVTLMLTTDGKTFLIIAAVAGRGDD
jgi:hypothetical protein